MLLYVPVKFSIISTFSVPPYSLFYWRYNSVWSLRRMVLLMLKDKVRNPFQVLQKMAFVSAHCSILSESTVFGKPRAVHNKNYVMDSYSTLMAASMSYPFKKVTRDSEHCLRCLCKTYWIFQRMSTSAGLRPFFLHFLSKPWFIFSGVFQKSLCYQREFLAFWIDDVPLA